MKRLSIILGKTVRKLTHLRGGGSALPGLVVEKTDPHFLRDVLSKLPLGVVVISGTNGKTTTTKIVSSLLEKQGLRVFTNRTGSNFVRGVISEIIADISPSGRFDYDVAVLELDEAHAVRFCEACEIDYALILNVQRDQLDRFGEIDHTAALLQKVAGSARRACVLNREDPRVSRIRAKNTCYFGLEKALLREFPSDDDLVEAGDAKVSTLPAAVTLKKLQGSDAVFRIGKKDYSCKLALKGIYNAYNAAGALALCSLIKKDVGPEKFIEDLSAVTSAFGRGESFSVNGCEVELLLVKNPSAFQLSIASFADDEHDYMIAINDRVADGRDVSWLWNVDFSRLPHVEVVSGVRAADMALRLKYDCRQFDTVEPDLEKALPVFLNVSSRPKRIFATYTAMLEIRKIISGRSIL